MARYVGARLLQLPVLLVVVSALGFVILRLGPGSPVDLATESSRDPEQIQRIRREWGLDQPLYVQYARYVAGLLRGDFGRSFFSNTPVAGVIVERFPAALELEFLSMLLGGLFGMAMGILAGVKEHTFVDTLARPLALTGISLPTFWLGLLGV